MERVWPVLQEGGLASKGGPQVYSLPFRNLLAPGEYRHGGLAGQPPNQHCPGTGKL